MQCNTECNGKGRCGYFHALSKVIHEIKIPLHTPHVLMKSTILFHNPRYDTQCSFKTHVLFNTDC